jgi:hypothetical protein
VPGPGRSANLVVDNAQLVALAAQAQHGLHEVGTMQAIHPTGAQDHETCARGGNRLLAFKLAAAVDGKRVGGVVFEVGARLGAVKDIVCRIVDQEGAEAPGLFGQDGRGRRIDPPRLVGFLLRAIHGGIGGCVHDRPGRVGANRRAQGVAVGEVDLVSVAGDQVSQAGQRTLEFATKLTGGADKQDRHA